MRGALAWLFLSGCCAFSGPTWQGPPSDHFDGERFHAPLSTARGTGDFFRWQAERKRPQWKEVEAAPGEPPQRRLALDEVRVTFVNHATVLLQAHGLNILTDPIWSRRCSPLEGLGPARYRPPGIRFEDLPPIDAVLLSHDHYDHMDVPTLRRIERAFPRARIYAGLGNAAFLRGQRLRHVYDLDWWQEIRFGRAAITGVPAQHFSGRGLCDRDGTLFLGYVVKGPAGAVFFAGDSGYGPHFAEVRRRLGPMRLALLPIGAYKPEWFMAPMHMSPAQAVQAGEDLGARTSLGVHFGTFQLADDGQDEPPEALRKALEGKGNRFWVLDFGEGRDVPP
jgi:L-ascorbate metabolism protein UlaG (beta-lactamase superfamily)